MSQRNPTTDPSSLKVRYVVLMVTNVVSLKWNKLQLKVKSAALEAVHGASHKESAQYPFFPRTGAAEGQWGILRLPESDQDKAIFAPRRTWRTPVSK